MAAVTRFEDLIAWQEARTLEQMVYKISNEGVFAKDFGLRDQIQRAAVSAMTNIAEGFDNESTAEFARFLGMARRSAVEVQSLLYVALDQKYITKEIFDACYEQAAKAKGIIGGLKRSLWKNPHTPSRTPPKPKPGT
jgi:four helix bundle protein